MVHRAGSTASNASVRNALVGAALRIVETEGAAAVSARRLAAEVGTSTMSVYTHFGSIAAVLGVVADQGFSMLGNHLVSAVSAVSSEDPLSDMYVLAFTYLGFARSRPSLYRTMFDTAFDARGTGLGQHADYDGSRTSLNAGMAALSPLSVTLSRMGAVKRDGAPSASLTTAQIWSAMHGIAMLRIAGYLGEDVSVDRSSLLALAVGNGIKRDVALRALEDAMRVLVHDVDP